MSALDTLLAGVAGRRDMQATKDRETYTALVVRLVDETPGGEDTPAKVAGLLERLDLDEQRLRADVARVRAHRERAATAARQDVVEGELRAVSDELTAFRVERKRIEGELQAREAELTRRQGAAYGASAEVARAERLVIGAAPREVVDRYEAARGALDAVTGDRTFLADLRRVGVEGPIVLPEHRFRALSHERAAAYHAAWKAAREAQVAHERAADELRVGSSKAPTPEQLEQLRHMAAEVRPALEAAEADALAELGAIEVERQRAVEDARRELLTAPPSLFPEDDQDDEVSR